MKGAKGFGQVRSFWCAGELVIWKSSIDALFGVKDDAEEVESDIADRSTRTANEARPETYAANPYAQGYGGLIMQ
jgi:hypothetical protein